MGGSKGEGEGGGLVRRLDAKAKRVGSLFGFLKGVLFVFRGACARARGGIILRREELEEEAGLLSFLFPLSRDPFFNTALSIFLFPPPGSALRVRRAMRRRRGESRAQTAMTDKIEAQNRKIEKRSKSARRRTALRFLEISSAAGRNDKGGR